MSVDSGTCRPYLSPRNLNAFFRNQLLFRGGPTLTLRQARPFYSHLAATTTLLDG